MGQMSIGEFARRSRLSPKALRLYDELELLRPARVDEDSGYRFYEPGQLERARLVAELRGLQMPLAEIKEVVELAPGAAAERVRGHWAAVEDSHAHRRALAGHLIDRLSGKESVMYEVKTREIPARSVLCLKRAVAGEQGAWTLGKEFLEILRRHELPRLDGDAGATFCIYWGEVSEDSDGPLEWCRPVPAAEAAALAARLPELTLRSEPAHREAFVELGRGGEVPAAQWQLIWDSVRAWTAENGTMPSEMGARITYQAAAGAEVPDCELAVPIETS